MTKRTMIVLLVGLNLLLAATLVLSTSRPAAAYAQAAPLGQNYLMVAAEIRDAVDGLYVIDLSQRRIHVFVPNRDQINRRIFHSGWRDLNKEFRGAR